MSSSLNKANESWMSPGAALKRFNAAQAKSGSLAGNSAEQTTTTQLRYGFRIGDIGLLIAPNIPSEALTHVPVYALPNTPDWFAGLGNLRGNIVPVYDLERLFVQQGGKEGRKYLIILGKGNDAVGITLQQLPQAKRFDDSLLATERPPLPDLLEPHVSETYINGEEIWLAFDHSSFFKTLLKGTGQ